MKKFSRILAMLLTVVVLLTAVPLSAFAKGTEPPTGPDKGTPGTGESGSVTVTLTAGALLDLVKAAGTGNKDAILASLKAMLDVTGTPLSMQDLTDLIPMENLVELLVGENFEKLPDLLEQIGGMSAVLGMVDPAALLASVSSDKMSDLIGLVDVNALRPLLTDAAMDVITDAIIDSMTSDAFGVDDFKDTDTLITEVKTIVEGKGGNLADYLVTSVKDSVAASLSNDLKNHPEAFTDLLKPEASLIDLQFLANNGTLTFNDVKDVFTDPNYLYDYARGTKTSAEFFNEAVDTDALFAAIGSDLLVKIQANPDQYLTDAKISSLTDTYFSTGMNALQTQLGNGTLSFSACVTSMADVIGTIPAANYSTLFGLFDKNVLIDQLKPHFTEFLPAISGEQIKTVINLLIATVLEKIDLIQLDGYAIGKENASGVLTLDFEALIAALVEILPTPAEIAESDDEIVCAFNLVVEYVKADNTDARKDINFRFVLGSGAEQIKKAVAVITRYISINKEGNTVAITVDTPAILAKLYNRAINLGNTEEAQALKEKILAAEGMTGSEMLDLLSELTLSEIVDVLDDVDVEALYTRVINIEKVQALLNKAKEVSGIDFDFASISDLNTVINAVANGALPSFEELNDALKARTKIDILKVLEKAATFADSNATVQSYLNKLSTVPGVSSFIGGMTAEEILDTYKDKDPAEAVAEFVSAKIHKDILEAMRTYTANELYRQALASAEARFTGLFERAKSFILRMADPDYEPQSKAEILVKSFLPESALNAFLNGSVLGFYRGNGTFSAKKENISVNLGTLTDKAIALLKKAITVDAGTESFLRSLLPESTVTFGISLTVNVTDVYKVTYNDENGQKLLTTFLPKGADPAVITVPEVTGKTAAGWIDGAGNLVTAIAGDCALYASYGDDTYTVSFYTTSDGGATFTLYEEIPVVNGSTVTVPDYAQPAELVNGTYTLEYYEGQSIDAANKTTKEAIEAAAVTADVSYTLYYALTDSFFDGGDTELTVTCDAEGNWTVSADAAELEIDIDATMAAFAEMNTITIRNNDDLVMTFGEEMTDLLQAATGTVHIEAKPSTQSVTYQDTTRDYFTCSSGSFFTFDVTVDGTKPAAFTDDFTVQIPFEDAKDATDTVKTVVYILDDTTHNIVETLTTTVSTANKTVTFTPPHFTDVVVTNEYLLTAEFKKDSATVAGTVSLNGTDLPAAGLWIPEGATVTNVVPTLGSAIIAANKIEAIKYGTAGTDLAIGGSLTMPSADTVITVTVKAITFAVYYLMPNGTALTTKAEANTWLATNAAPAGYDYVAGTTAGTFEFLNEPADATNLSADVYCVPKLAVKSVTVTFKYGAGTDDKIEKTVTIENYTSFIAPSVPEKIGNTGAWNGFSTDALLQIIKGEKSAVVEAVYTPNKYRVTYVNGTSTDVEFDAAVNPKSNYTTTTGYEIDKIYYRSVNGLVEVTTDTFKMIAGDVEIVITEKPLTVSYQLKNNSDSGNPKGLSATFGTAATFEISLKNGETLYTAPSVGTLVGFRVENDGTRTLVYSFDVNAAFLSGSPVITYDAAKNVPETFKLYNGELSGDVNPAGNYAKKGLKFLAYKTPANGDGSFISATYAFATFERAETSRLWLWILLGVILFIAIIALLYTLYVREILKPNFILRFVAWLVSIFFALCLGIVAIVAAIGHLFGKKKDVDYNENGFEDPKNNG